MNSLNKHYHPSISRTFRINTLINTIDLATRLAQYKVYKQYTGRNRLAITRHYALRHMYYYLV